MTETEKAIRDFCGHHADWWPSTTQVQEMLALAQPEQEPVAWIDEFGNAFPLAAKQYSVVGKHWKPLYTTTPPQRTWVGMTEDEAIELLPEGDWEIESTLDFAQAIEAKLKEKNT